MDDKCKVCENLEEGDTLYQSHGWDHGIEYEYIEDIKYCPVCGEKLITGKEKWHKIVESGNSEN